jgi:hypothetical protein
LSEWEEKKRKFKIPFSFKKGKDTIFIQKIVFEAGRDQVILTSRFKCSYAHHSCHSLRMVAPGQFEACSCKI